MPTQDASRPPASARTLVCPRDGATLATQEYEAKIEIDVCPTCKGAWLDEGELEAIQETVERDYASAEPSRDTMPSGVDEPHGAITCPACSAPMDARPYGFGSQIVIDVCSEAKLFALVFRLQASGFSPSSGA
jgi:Zn-finger nucleic acid-binding protein